MQREGQYKIRGLDCSAEVALLEKALKGRPGIISLACDIMQAKLIVTYDDEMLDDAQIRDAVSGTGLLALPWAELQPTEGAGESEGFWQRHGRFVAAGASLLFLVAGVVSHWVLHGGAWETIAPGDMAVKHIFPLLTRELYVVSIVAGAWYVLPQAWRSVRRLQPDINFLMIVAVVGAVSIGEWSEAATIAMLFSVALLLEHWSVERARRAVAALLQLAPDTALLVSPDGEIAETPTQDVPVEAVVLSRPGERIPLDGTVVSGQSAVNQAPITGESMPVEKVVGDEVFAGSINGDGALEIKVTKVAGDTVLSRIIKLVQQAQTQRAESERWIDRFSRYYTPAMMALAVLIAAGPPLLGLGNWHEWLYRGLVILVIACPCALVISTPVAVVSGMTAAARQGVLIKGGKYLEQVARLRALAMDKTGTLTFGQAEVQGIYPEAGHTEEEVLRTAAALELMSQHPLAVAIVRRARKDGLEPERATSFQALQGRGAEAEVAGVRYWIGSRRLLEEKGLSTEDILTHIQELEQAGHSVIILGDQQQVLGLVATADEVRPTAAAVISELKALGLEQIVMLTGDNAGAAHRVASLTGVDTVKAGLLPAEKVAAVESLGHRWQSVAMVGDGVNDAPAMAAASLGIAMGAIGSDAAIETGDIVLMSDDLSKLPWLVGHARRTLATIQQNVGFALGLKALFIVLALTGTATLWMAIVADTGASLLVIFNGLRLLKTRKYAAPTGCARCGLGETPCACGH
ncbi:MAG: heavy metal translocating P-type ATPase [Armatimonadota bacterium]